jgi:hypothetical protein
MNSNTLPGHPGHQDPRQTFLTGKEVFARFGWGRTYGYAMLSSTGFPPAIGLRYRLDTILAWEDDVIAGKLPGHPDRPSPEADQVDSLADTAPGAATEQSEDKDEAADSQPALVAAPTRSRSRGKRRAA